MSPQQNGLSYVATGTARKPSAAHNRNSKRAQGLPSKAVYTFAPVFVFTSLFIQSSVVKALLRGMIEKSSATWRVNRLRDSKDATWIHIRTYVNWSSIDPVSLGRQIVISTNLCVRDKCRFYDQWINGRLDCVTGTWTLRHHGLSNCKRIYQQVRRSSLSQHGRPFRIILARAGQ